MARRKVNNKSVADLIDKFLGDGIGIDGIMLRFRNSVIVHALTLTEGNVSRAAVMLKTHRNNLERWLKEYRLEEEYIISEEIQKREARTQENPQADQI